MAGHPRYDPAPTARETSAGHSHCTDSDGGRSAQSESASDSSPRLPFSPLGRRGIRAVPESTYHRRAIPRVLPGCSTTRENDTGWSGAKWDRSTMSRPPSRPPTPPAVRAGGRVLPQIAVLKIGEQPTVLAGLVIQLYLCSIVTSSSAPERGHTSAEARHGPRRDQGPVRRGTGRRPL